MPDNQGGNAWQMTPQRSNPKEGRLVVGAWRPFYQISIEMHQLTSWTLLDMRTRVCFCSKDNAASIFELCGANSQKHLPGGILRKPLVHQRQADFTGQLPPPGGVSCGVHSFRARGPRRLWKSVHQSTGQPAMETVQRI